MSTFKCKMCGGTLEIQSGSTVAECEYCGAKQTLPKLDDEKRANLYDRANHFRRSNEFDKASAIYEQILNEDTTDAEAYWSLVLCRYGIEYVEDPLSHRRVPTVHRAQFTSIFDDNNYKLALKNADSYQRIIYEEEAKAINEIQKGILAISQKEEPFDVFICYKETDDSGKRTHDSVLAQDLYYQLKQEGFKVFFARITLEDKLGSAYEPYIFAALNSAKVMVVLGTKPEYFNAVWVKNEWSRFLSLIKQGEKKMLIPAYKDMDPYNLPKEFSHLQAQDMSKLGFMQDLLRGIKKILGYDKKTAAPVTERVIVQGDGHDIAPLLRRTFLFLEDGEFDSADEYAEKVLDINPECAEAYVAKLLIEFELKKPSDLAMNETPISDSPNYQKAIRFATPEYRETVEGYNNAIIKRLDAAHKDEMYARGVELMKFHRYDEAVQYFQKIPSYKDATQKIDDCKKLKETERRDAIYSRATQLMNGGLFGEAAHLFESIEDYKDAKEKIKLCAEKKEVARKDMIYSLAMNRVIPQNANDVAIKKSIEELKTISGYRDVDDQIRALDTRLEKWYADKKKAEEEAQIRAEEERRTREREAELKRLREEEKRRKAKKAATIGIPSAIALVTLLVLLFTLVIPLIRYNQADTLFNAGKYEEAMAIYRSIGGFSESEQRLAVLSGIETIDKTDFKGGIKQILSAGVPVKLTCIMDGGHFSDATQLSTSQVEYTYNSSADFSDIPTPSKSGYCFVEWSLEAYNYQIDGTFEIKVKAIWGANEYTITYDDVKEVNKSATITFNYNYSGSTSTTSTLTNNGQKLNYPTPPKRDGYVFTGWYKDSACKTRYAFTGSITKDMTLYAGWMAQYSSAQSNYIIINPANYSSSTQYYSVATDETNSSSQKYIYLVANESGTHFIYYKNGSSSSSYKTYIGVTNLTTNKTIKSTTFCSSTSYDFLKFTCNAGDVIAINLYKSSQPTNAYFYFSGFNTPTSSAVAADLAKEDGMIYDDKSTHVDTVKYNENYTLPTPTRTGYTFGGWFNSGTKVQSGAWNIASNVTLKARWTGNQYTITLDANGGSVSSNTLTVTYDTNYKLPIPTRTGYTFAGWYDGSTQFSSGKWTTTSNVKLTAKWSKDSYSVSYNMNGGTNATANPKTYTVNDSFMLAVPTKTGYTFLGWTYEGQSTPTLTVTITEGTTGNLSFTANWKGSDYTITFDANGGSVSTESQTVTYGSDYTLPIPTKTGHTFLGWYEDDTQVTDGTWARTSDLALTARWEATNYSVSYEMDGGVDATANPSDYTINDSFTLVAPTKTGYTFLGWTYEGQSTPTLTVSIAEGTTGNLSYTANWEIINYTITLDANGGSVSSTSITVNYNSSYTLPEATKTGYTFAGWYNGTVRYTSGTWTELSNVTLTAKWTFNEYSLTYENVTIVPNDITVTFDYNYSGSTATTVTLSNGQTLSYPTVPTRSGYAFAGWYTDSDCTTSYAFSDTITEDITIYAKWVSMTSSYYSVEYVDIANYNNSSNKKSVTASSYYSTNYYYFTCYTTGSYTLNAYYTSGDFYFNAYNVTQGTSLMSTNLYGSNTSKSITFTANAGDVIYVSLYKYSSSGSAGYGTFYVTNASYPTSTATASCSEVAGLVYDTTSNHTIFVEFGENFTLLEPTREGYTFNGWYNGDTKFEDGVWNITDNVTLTARWTANTYTITFDANGGSVASDSQTVTYDSGYTLPTPTRTGYTFGGWFCGDAEYAGGTWLTTENTTLVAQWTPNNDISYVVNHYQQNANDDEYTLESTENLTGTADAEITPAVKSFTHFISPSAQTVTIAPDGSLIVNYYYDRVTYDLTYVTNGGDTIETQTYKYDQTLVVATPTRTDYTFGGWFTDAALSTAYSATATLNQDITIYAYWTEENKPTDFTYSGTDSITISGYSGTDTTPVVPSYIGGVPVYEIAELAFANNTTITKVTIPNTVMLIGEGILSGCTSLEELEIDSLRQDADGPRYSVENSASYPWSLSNGVLVSTNKANNSSSTYKIVAIQNCTLTLQYKTSSESGYDKLTIYKNGTQIAQTSGSPSYVTLSVELNIGDYVTFVYSKDGSTSSGSDCAYIKGVESEHRVYVHVLGHFFGNTSAEGTTAVSQNGNTYYIPSSLRKVSYSTNNIASYMFENCTMLEEISIYGATTIGHSAFKNCTSLTRIQLPNTVTSIDSYAFSSCTELEDIEFAVGCNLETIGNYAFADCISISEIQLPTTVTSIGNYAFSGCISLEMINSDTEGEMILPDNITTIGEYAFQNILLVTKVVIPESVTSIGLGAFKGCNAIEDITLPFVGKSAYAVAHEAVFGYIFGYATTADENLTNSYSGYYYYIPTSIKTVVITIGNSISSQSSQYIYHDGHTYQVVALSKNWEDAKTYCEQLGGHLATIGSSEENAFISSIASTSMWLGAQKNDGSWSWIDGTQWNYTNWESGEPSGGNENHLATGYCTADKWNDLTESEIHYFICEWDYTVGEEERTQIPNNAFYNCNFIEMITIPNTVTSIGDYAFQNCSALKRLNSTTDGEFDIPEGVTTINSYTFYACTEMQKVTFATESKLETIGNYAFTDCVNLSEIQLPTTVTSIGTYAFSGCISIAKINSDTEGEMLLPENVTTIGEYAFKNLELITKVDVPESVTSIGLGAFKGCNAIEDITLPFVGKSADATYYEAAFGYIFGYQTVTGSSYGSYSQTFINTVYGTSDAVWQYSAYNGSYYYNSNYYCQSYYYYIPATIKNVTITVQTAIPTAAFNNCDFIKTITIPNTVTSIGDYAFQNCDATVNQTYVPKLSFWNGTDISTSFLGSGTEADPYQINSAADLAYLASSVNAGTNYEGKYFVLNVDLNLNNESWTPIGTKAAPFAGTFDGNGKKIYNLSVTMDVANAGLFGYVSGTIKELGIVSGTISPASTSASTYVGGLVGYLTGKVENCYSCATLNVSTVNTTYAGSLIGYVDTATVEDSYAAGNVTVTSTSGFAYAGGFVGMNKGTIENSLAFGNVTAKGQNDSYSRNGGFAAKNDGTLTECYRSESQILTKYTTAGDAYCDDGTVDSYSDMISYAQTNWDSSIWEYELKYPTHK